MDREHTCCFTGHRTERLPWGDNENDPRCLALKDRLDEVFFELDHRLHVIEDAGLTEEYYDYRTSNYFE